MVNKILIFAVVTLIATLSYAGFIKSRSYTAETDYPLEIR